MLIHSLWQGAIFAAIAGLLLMFAKRWTAAARYNMMLLLFAGLLIVSFFTFTWQLLHIDAENNIGSLNFISVHGSGFFFQNTDIARRILNTISIYCTQHAILIVVIWCIVFTIKLIKIPGALLYNRQIKNKQIFQPDLYWKKRMIQLSSSLNIKKAVALLESAYMKVPVVVGHFKPVILIPLGLLSSLPAEQVEAILLHELAHIRRNDYLVNIFQHIAVMIFFFNPAILWFADWLNEERENCCDDIALEKTQNKQGLIEALISFKQHQLYGAVYSTTFPGRKNHLLRRVGRIAGINNKSNILPLKILYSIACIIVLTGAIVMMTEAKGSNKITNFSVADNVSKTADIKILIADVHAEINKAVPEKAIATAKRIYAPKKIVSVTESARKESQEIEKQKTFLDDQQKTGNKKQSVTDELKTKSDAEKALLDQRMAILDQQQAKSDQEQAMKDQQQAKIDQEQAIKDQLAAKRIEEKSAQDQSQSAGKIDRENALKQKKEAERIRLQH